VAGGPDDARQQRFRLLGLLAHVFMVGAVQVLDVVPDVLYQGALHLV
jgi:hypothetical protein